MEPVVFAAEQFGFYAPFFEALTDGLIHQTYKVSENNRTIILQQVNTTIFTDADLIIRNYALIDTHLKQCDGLKIPAAVTTKHGNQQWIDSHGGYWRAFEYLENTYTETLPATPEKIFSAAQCYGNFTQALATMHLHQLQPTLAHFHDLTFRYQQLQHAVQIAKPERLKASNVLLEKIEAHKSLVVFYDTLKTNPEFQLRAMHHDTKLSNILFDRFSGQAVCPIDLDTTMPGYFFSDVGDMIRSMVSPANENAPAEAVLVNRLVYEAILSGYQSGIGDSFTQRENNHIHQSGSIMLYMQAIRFLTDYLSNDVYYRITYPEQNFNRALNQITLLEKLETFLRIKTAEILRN